MGDDSERLHLEGLDEATERERWEERFAAPTDLPDAVVNAAVEAFARKRNPKHNTLDHSETLAIRAALAAASGPWAEQLDAARPECTRAYCAIFDDWQKIAADRDAALARNAELGDAVLALGEKIVALQSTSPGSEAFLNDVLAGENQKIKAEHDTLRAELDSLRETLAQKIEAEGKKVVQWLADTRSDATDMGRLIGTEDAYKHAAAIVRGSDDEAACAACGHPRLRHEFVKVSDTHCSECKCPEWVAR